MRSALHVLRRLAKAEALPSGDEETTGKVVTQDGMIAGTLQYMSPEQLQDGHADARSEIFGFGCVFYEMLTGKRAFEGKSARHREINNSRPRPISNLRSTVSKMNEAGIRSLPGSGVRGT